MMMQHRSGLLIGVLFAAAQLHGQTSAPNTRPSSPGQKQAGVTRPQQMPLTQLVSCESFDAACSSPNASFPFSWTFSGSQGKLHLLPGTVADIDLTVERYDSNSIVIHRADRTGPAAGLIGTYTGTIDGKHISGTSAYDWPGHPDFPKGGTWSAEILDPRVLEPENMATGIFPVSVPLRLIECEGDAACDGVWSFQGSAGKAVWPRQAIVLADLTVTRFGPGRDGIEIHRLDTSEPDTAVVYKGTLEGNRITGGAVLMRNGQSVPYTWTATIPATSCTRSDGLKPDTQESIKVGMSALQFKLLPQALDCFLIAARNGNADAQNSVASLYYQGGDSPIKQDYNQTFLWMSRSAVQGNYTGEVSLAALYQHGQGTPADPDKYQYWAAKAAANPGAPVRRVSVGDALGSLLLDLATIPDNGSGSQKDDDRRAKWEQCYYSHDGPLNTAHAAAVAACGSAP